MKYASCVICCKKLENRNGYAYSILEFDESSSCPSVRKMHNYATLREPLKIFRPAHAIKMAIEMCLS